MAGTRRMARSGEWRHGGRLPRRSVSITGWGLAAVVAGALIFIFATDSGRLVRKPDSSNRQFAEAARIIGLGIEHVWLSGHRQTLDRSIYAALDLEQNVLLTSFDSAQARQRIEELPWVDKATVSRIFPNTLKIVVSERKPFAVWKSDGASHLVDGNGRTLGPAIGHVSGTLPIVAGPGAGQRVREVVTMVQRHPELRHRIAEARFVGRRRWSLVVRGGPLLHLPDQNWELAVERFLARPDRDALLSRNFAAVDLRAREGIVVRPAVGVTKGPAAGEGAPAKRERLSSLSGFSRRISDE